MPEPVLWKSADCLQVRLAQESYELVISFGTRINLSQSCVASGSSAGRVRPQGAAAGAASGVVCPCLLLLATVSTQFVVPVGRS